MRSKTSGLIPHRDQLNNSEITFPLLAILMGLPLVLVKLVSSEIPMALQTLAIKSSEVYE